jgi:protein-tyrosine-phosphatase
VVVAVERVARFGFGILGLSIGYFLWYAPYAGLTKALSNGLLPGMDAQVGGLVLLPAAALGTVIGCLVFLVGSGWWRHAYGRREPTDAPAPWPRRSTVIAGLFMALIIATTTLNYTFAGVSILFMLLMMRGGVLILSPIVDVARRRKVRPYSWAALAVSLLAVAVLLGDVDSYHLTVAATLSLAVYLGGYIGRFQIMSRLSKNGDVQVARRYLVEEQVAAVVWQVALCALLALVGPAVVSAALREGFTSFLLTPAVVPALAVGLLYSGLFVYGTLIYLGPREFTWCVPANRCASLLSGVVASYALTALVGVPPPGSRQLVATGLIGVAALALSYPTLRALYDSRRVTAARRLLFVCGGNTGRSALAEAFARAELADVNGGGPKWGVHSAGLTAHQPGAPMADHAVVTLREHGVRARRHRSRQLTPQMCRDSAAVYCMTRAQRAAVAELAPEVRDRTFCLDPARDIPDPATAEDPATSYRQVAELIRHRVRDRVHEHLALAGGARLQPQAGG